MMCPKPEVLSQWADGSLNPRESLEVSRHAETCDACRAKAEQLRAVGNWITSAAQPGRACLSADDMAAVLEGGRVPAHVRTCLRCASEFRALRGAERKAATRRRQRPQQSPVMAWAAAAAVFIGILIVVASQPSAPKQDPMVQINVRPQPVEPTRTTPPAPPATPPKAPLPGKTTTAQSDPLRPNPLNPSVPAPTPDPVAKDPLPTTPKPTVVEPPPTPTPVIKPVEAPRPVAALNIRAGGLTTLTDGKWVKPSRFEEGMALRAEGRTQLEFAQARITLDPASHFSVAKDDFSLSEGGMSAEVATNSKFALVLDEQRIVPQTQNGRVLFTAKPTAFVVDEGSAKLKDTVFHEGVEHIVKKDKVEAVKRRTLAAAARPRELTTWKMDLSNANTVRSNVGAGSISKTPQGNLLTSETLKGHPLFYGAAGYLSTGDEPYLFVVKANTAIRFRYYMTQPGQIELMLKNQTKDENFNRTLEGVVRASTTVTLYVRDILPNIGGKKVTCDVGDQYRGISWNVGKPGAPTEIYIDRFEILEIDR